MLRTLTVPVCMFVVLAIGTSASADLFDDFSGPQTGSWAPARWWDDYACRGQFIVPAKKTPKLDVGFSSGRRASDINAAEGFVIEVDLLEIKGDWAAVSVGTGDIEKAAVAVVLQSDNSSSQDQVYVYGKSWSIGNQFNEGQKVRIEIDTRNISNRGEEAALTVLFGNTEVVSNYRFQWQKAPRALYLVAGNGQAVFDNLRIAPAGPAIEFERSSSRCTEGDSPAAVNVLLKHPESGQTYSVDYEVTGGTAQGKGVDYTLSDGTLTFRPGQREKTISIPLKNDRIDECDEAIELALSHPRGRNVQLGHTVSHTCTIVDRWPTVFFDSAFGRGAEDVGSAKITVELSHSCSDIVSVNYELAGGTATNGRDYNLADGILKFGPGQVRKDIRFNIIDDTDGENSINETVILTLANPKNAALGPTARHVYEIIDNEPGIGFDGGVWMCTYDKHKKIKGRNVLSVNDAGQLEWVCTYGDLLLAQLPQKRVSEVGDVAEYAWLYKGEGQDKGSYVENICERYGSGDLRVALLDSAGNPLSMNKQYARNDKIFCGYKGYQARLSPHVPTNQRADKWAIRVNPNGDNCWSPVDWGGCWGFAKYFNGYGVPVGKFSPMIIQLERTAKDTIAFSVTLNDIKHTYVDKDKSPYASDIEKMESLYGTGSRHVVVVPGYQPRNIDTMAIYFANQRPFDLITFAKIER